VKIQIRSAFLFNQLIQINNAKNMCDDELRLRSRTGTKAFFTTFFVERRKRRMKKLTRLWGIVLLSAGLLTACSGGNSSTPPLESGTTAEQTGSPGSWTINAVGGSGGTGGNGGFLYMETYQQQGVKIMKAGTASTTFTVPNYNPPTDLGTTGEIITADTTVPALISGASQTLASGALYLIQGDGDCNVLISTGTGTVPVPGFAPPAAYVTGLKVNAGVTVTLGLNNDTNSNGSMDEACLYFPNDVDIAGTIKTEDLLTSGSTDTRHFGPSTDRDMGALNLSSNMQIFVRSTGSIITKGLNGASAGQRGGDGGYINLSAGNYFINQGTIDNSGGNSFDSSADGGSAGVSSGSGIYLQILVDQGTGPIPYGLGGVIINTGKLISNGGTGATGGQPAEVSIIANSDLFNTGPITANGGKGMNGNGGSGFAGVFQIMSIYGSIYNSGALSQAGGNGTAGGGDGGTFLLYAGKLGYTGDVVNSGSITADAGSATNSGSGGNGWNISLYASGAIRTSGKISINGGDSMGANNGGIGGTVTLQNYVPYDYAAGSGSSPTPVRPIQVSGNMYLNGGASKTGTGGRGGKLYVYQAKSGAEASNTGIQFLGYASANFSGGFGTVAGGSAFGNGSGLSMKVITYNDYPGNGSTAIPPGPIINQINITTRGGNSNGTGGWGGMNGWGISMQTGTLGDYFGPGGVSTVTNTGKLDTSGGTGGSGNGGIPGEIYLFGHDGVTNTGSLIARGGSSTGGGDGKWGGNISILSGLNITNSGPIDASGGSGAIGGGGGNDIQIYAGGKVTNTGSIACAGGAGSTGSGGNGYIIDIMSETGGTSNTGALNVSGGPGNPHGSKGQVWIDWVQVK
jgi:hypothetical protein